MRINTTRRRRCVRLAAGVRSRRPSIDSHSLGFHLDFPPASRANRHDFLQGSGNLRQEWALIFRPAVRNSALLQMNTDLDDYKTTAVQET